MNQSKLPPGWDEARIRRVLDYYENQTEDEAVAEDEAAFNSQMEGNEKYAKRCVHHALLAQYCRQLGHDGVRIFFSR